MFSLNLFILQDYERQLASYTSGLETLLSIPIKRTMVQSPSGVILQEVYTSVCLFQGLPLLLYRLFSVSPSCLPCSARVNPLLWGIHSKRFNRRCVPSGLSHQNTMPFRKSSVEVLILESLQKLGLNSGFSVGGFLKEENS